MLGRDNVLKLMEGC